MVIGIDGGGTRTRAAIVADDGAVLGLGESGPSNPQSVGAADARVSLRVAIRAARDAAGITDAVDAAFLGIAGVVSEVDRAAVRTMALDIGLADGSAIEVDHDLRAALAGGLALAPGLVLIAGTGSSCYGRTADGRTWRAGGWGPLLDDVGSAWWLAVSGLAAVTRAADERGPATLLTERLPAALGLADLLDLLRITGTANVDRARIAALAPVVLDVAAMGDDVAGQIVQHGIEELARMVQAVAGRLSWYSAPLPVVVSGGLGQQPSFRRQLELTILQRTPEARLIEPALPPVLGAALLALESCGRVGSGTIDRLRAGSPGVASA